MVVELLHGKEVDRTAAVELARRIAAVVAVGRIGVGLIVSRQEG